jgi:hypothetical protein
MNMHIITGLVDIHKLREDGYGDEEVFLTAETGEELSIPDMLYLYDGQKFTVISEN